MARYLPINVLKAWKLLLSAAFVRPTRTSILTIKEQITAICATPPAEPSSFRTKTVSASLAPNNAKFVTSLKTPSAIYPVCNACKGSRPILKDTAQRNVRQRSMRTAPVWSAKWQTVQIALNRFKAARLALSRIVSSTILAWVQLL